MNASQDTEAGYRLFANLQTNELIAFIALLPYNFFNVPNEFRSNTQLLKGLKGFKLTATPCIFFSVGSFLSLREKEKGRPNRIKLTSKSFFSTSRV